MKPMYVGLVLMALVCAVGIASAVEGDNTGTTQVDGTVLPLTLTLTAPSDITGWGLVRGADNQYDFPEGSLVVKTNDASGIPCTLTVTTDNGGYMYFTPDVKTSYLQTPLNIWDGSAWQSLGSTINIGLASVSTTEQNVPLHLQQHVTSTDVGHDYTIQLTFTLSQATL